MNNKILYCSPNSRDVRFFNCAKPFPTSMVPTSMDIRDKILLVKSIKTATFIDSEQSSENMSQKLLDSGLNLYNPTYNPNPLIISTEDPLTLAVSSKKPCDLTIYISYARQLHSITYIVPHTEAMIISQLFEINIPNVYHVISSPQEIITCISTKILCK